MYLILHLDIDSFLNPFTKAQYKFCVLIQFCVGLRKRNVLLIVSIFDEFH